MNPLDRALANALGADRLFAVGGRVRDEVRAEHGEPAVTGKDLDYVVVGRPLGEIVERLRPLGRVDIVGAAFSVVKVSLAEGDAEIALPRRERSTGVGHRDFEVEAGPDVSLEEDLARRDFRMNMLARRIADGALLDPYGGVEDIRCRRIDIVQPQAFAEDPLRMLRAAQFAARFRYALSAETVERMRESSALASSVSAERIHDEILKLLGAERPSIGFMLLAETGVLGAVWPELVEGDGVSQNRWHRFDVWRHALATVDATPAGDPILRLAALLHDIGKSRTKDGPHFYRHEIVGEAMAGEMLARLRFSNEAIETIQSLVRHHMYHADPDLAPATIRRFIRRVGIGLLGRLFALRAADVAGSGLPKRGSNNERFEARVAEIVSERPPFTVKDLAITGDDVIAELVRVGALPAGSKGSPQVGEILRRIFEEVTDDPRRNTRDQLIASIRRAVDGTAGVQGSA
ncbi:MAG: HD domain-containing protein [Candidatus Eremiobacteraeota bacterium]|nr:HD domain-containing protein [Candidatus Eremiobacteraeota bacterium]